MEQGKLKKCRFCGEDVPVYSGRCHYCGSLLDIRIDGEYRGKSENPYDNVAVEVPEKTFKTQEPLSNGIKVLLTVIASLIPGIGQLAGIIAAIIYMNTEEDADRRSFGVALLVASLVVFVFTCVAFSILAIAVAFMHGY